MNPRPKLVDEALSLLYTRPDAAFSENSLKQQLQQLHNDTSESGNRYKHYRESLLALRTLDPASMHYSSAISDALAKLLSEMVLDTLTAYGLNADQLLSQGSINLCVSGSIAAGTATPFSDVDSCIIISDTISQSDQATIRHAIKSVTNISDLLFADINQFAFDQFGMSIKTLSGTMPEIFAHIRNIGDDAVIISIINAKSILPHSEGDRLLTKFRQHLLNSTPRFNADYFFRKIADEFPGPKWNASEINLKMDVLRPIELMILGLKIMAGLAGRSFHSTHDSLKTLRNLEVIDKSTYDLIIYLRTSASELRGKLHTAASRESEWIKTSDTNIDFITLTALLRGSLLKWLTEGKSANDCLVLQFNQYVSGGQRIDAPSSQFMKLQSMSELINKIQAIKQQMNEGKFSLFNAILDDQFHDKINLLEHAITELTAIQDQCFRNLLGGHEIDLEKKLNNLTQKLANVFPDCKQLSNSITDIIAGAADRIAILDKPKNKLNK